MIFPTTSATLQQRLPYPAGPFALEMPVVRLEVESVGFTVFGKAHIDTMADSIILPDLVARQLQIDLTNAPAGPVTVIGGAQVMVRYAQVHLKLQTARQSCRWPTWVGFTVTKRWLFGFFGGLEHFHFTLDAANEELILVPRDHLPAVA